MQKFKESRNRSSSKVCHNTIPSVAVFVEMGTSWGRRLVAGVIEYAKQHGPWHILIEPRGPEEKLHVPAHWKPDGIIARISSSAVEDRLHAMGVPIVNVSSIRIPGAEYPRVLTNPATQASMAVELFHSRGFRNYGYAGNPALGHVREQYHAFETCLSKHDFKPHLYRQKEGDEEMIPWLRGLPKPVAILCWGHLVGRTVIDACLTAGISVPHDVAVLGGDHDDILSEASYPAQSGIKTNAEQIGMKASAVLDEMMHGRDPVRMEWEIEPNGVIEKLSTDTLAVADKRLSSVMKYIFAHAHKPISVEDILHENPMARRSLERKFRLHFGCTIVDQIRKTRVNKARLLLAESNDPITLVAEKCGFLSYNYMSRIFHEVTGMSPRQFRSQCRTR